MHNKMELVHWSNATMWTCKACQDVSRGNGGLVHIPHSTSFLKSQVLDPLLFFHSPWSLILLNIVSFNSYPPKGWKKSNESETFCCALQIFWTFSALCWQSTVSRSSRQFLDCPDSLWILRTVFWIIRTVSRLSGNFLDCQDSLLTIRIVFGLSGQFLECPDNFWIVRKVLGLSG